MAGTAGASWGFRRDSLALGRAGSLDRDSPTRGRNERMIGIVATLKIQDGKNAEFEAAFKEAMAAVRANEPGNLFYELVKSRTDPTSYKVLEGYKDDAAIAAHRDSAH